MSETATKTAPPLEKKTTVGNYFVSNYPPFSFWKQEDVPDYRAALGQAPKPDTQLGIYVHIPFCRKRCHFVISASTRTKTRRRSAITSTPCSRS